MQAISTMALVFLTAWAVFFSDVGELATLLLQSELVEAKRHIETIRQEKEGLQRQKRQLQDEQNELAKDRNEYISSVVRDRLGDIWFIGLKMLSTYKKVATLGREIFHESEQMNLYRSSEQYKNIVRLKLHWYKFLPESGKIYNEKRSEWNEILLDWDGAWECSRDASESFYDHSRLEYHLFCFDEWEKTFRKHIEISSDEEIILTIGDLAEWLLQWATVNDASEEVTRRLRNKLTREIDTNRQLGSLVIQLRLPKDVSLTEIATEAKKVEGNVVIARDWLDEATRDRFMIQIN